MGKSKVKLPEGVNTIRELVARYMTMSDLSKQAIRNRIEKDHGIVLTDKQIEGGKYEYRRSLGLVRGRKGGKKKPVPSSNGKQLAPVQTLKVEVNNLKRFADAVKLIGGRKIAISILTLFEE